MNKFLLGSRPVFFLLSLCITQCSGPDSSPTEKLYTSHEISQETLKNKIMGGWAGQVIGCTYGGPTEFNYNGTMINDYTPVPWDASRISWYYENAPGLYDDVYMDLTFVDVFEREGLDAPAESHAMAFAHAEYPLWHANQAARYNILNGIMPPQSGNWKFNPHSDDIDFQIEADFAGLMSPGMVNAASGICDRVGHIMNYGDGWYGGVYVAAMYSLAFITDDIKTIVTEALKVIPSESRFYNCIKDVINWSEQFPDDWKRTWFECQRKWSEDRGCPDGVFRAFDIDAMINAAYIVIGLLYGEGDFGQTIDISTRCGQDSDCNPASSGGILGTVLGYDHIPEYWKQGLDKVEDRDFKFTEISLKDVYGMSTRHAVEMIKRNGGHVNPEGLLVILAQEPDPVRLEQGFPGLVPSARTDIWRPLDVENPEFNFEFEGTGFVLKGSVSKNNEKLDDRELELEVLIDGTRYETALLPTSFRSRRHEITWNYELEDGKHKIDLLLKDPVKGYSVNLTECLVYSGGQN